MIQLNAVGVAHIPSPFPHLIGQIAPRLDGLGGRNQLLTRLERLVVDGQAGLHKLSTHIAQARIGSFILWGDVRDDVGVMSTGVNQVFVGVFLAIGRRTFLSQDSRSFPPTIIGGRQQGLQAIGIRLQRFVQIILDSSQ